MMKSKMLVACLLVFMAVTVQEGLCIVPGGDYTIVNQTKKAVLVISGKVTDIEYVQSNAGGIFTDVTVTVHQAFKKEPNIDENATR